MTEPNATPVGAHTPARELGVACLNCATALTGPFCAQCGQRHRDASDRTLRSIAIEWVQALTSFDSRWWHTLRLLVAGPGRLTENHIAGRRVGQLGPVTLFLLASVVLYLGVPVEGDFYAAAGVDPKARLVLDEPPLPAWIAARVAARGETPAAAARRFASRAPEFKKALLILIAPFLAVPLALIFWRRDRLVADHVVFAFHLTSALLLFFAVFVSIFDPAVNNEWLMSEAPWLVGGLLFGSFAALYAYVVVALRRVYGLRVLAGLGGGLALLAVTVLGLGLFARGRDLFIIWWLTRA